MRASLLLLLASVFLSRLSQAQITGTIELPSDPMPPGFNSREAAMAAILTKQVKLIEPPTVIPESVIEHIGITYGEVDSKELKLDLSLPAKAEHPRPGLIFIHGGSWSGGTRDVYKYYTTHFAQQGYVCATVSYRLSGEACFPAAIHDVKAAVRWMRGQADSYGVDATRIGVVGGSAGGHLALLLGYSPRVQDLEGESGSPEVSSEVQAVVNFYGVADLTTEQAKTSSAVKNFLCGKRYEDDQTLYELASPITHLGRSAPPTLTIHGSIDQVVFVEQAERLSAKLSELKVPYATAILPGWPHALDAAEAPNDYCLKLMSAFLKTAFSIPGQNQP